jgi:hypothetical protein
MNSLTVKQKLDMPLGTERSLVPRPAYKARGELERVLAENASGRFDDVAVYYVFDITHSMESYISAVRDCIHDIGSATLDAHENVSACVLGVGEHRTNDHGREIQFNLGDYGIDNSLTSKKGELKKQIDLMPCFKSGNNDFLEAYECLAYDLSEKIFRRKQESPSRRSLVVFFGDSGPHYGPNDIMKLEHDRGCPNKRDRREINKLVQTADHTYFIDCGDKNGLKLLTFLPSNLNEDPKATYFRFSDASDVLRETIISMTKKAISNKAFIDYTRSLPPEISGRVVQLIGYSGDK